ncbi:MAG: hypothetical protein V7L21_19490 [Nostoc sp.]|uniref:hypothetical protein n=1 Tax=unclassified Nostoc TaxID=2593658 RepID=UPI0025D2E675|nr:hypothetical protein [Nostoc sp. NMS9]MBN3940248.1 hypothetical protein [Nostoc sp. NMS9]
MLVVFPKDVSKAHSGNGEWGMGHGDWRAEEWTSKTHPLCPIPNTTLGEAAPTASLRDAMR